MEKYFEDGISKCLYAFNYDDEYGNNVDVLSTYDEDGVNYNTIIENGILAGRSIMVEIKDGYNFHNLYEPSIIRYDEDGEIWSREYYVLGKYITDNKNEFFKMKEKCINLSILKSITENSGNGLILFVVTNKSCRLQVPASKYDHIRTIFHRPRRFLNISITKFGE